LHFHARETKRRHQDDQHHDPSEILECLSDRARERLVFPRFEGHLSAFGETRRKLTKEVQSAEDETTIPA
jgi:hypothetical protein